MFSYIKKLIDRRVEQEMQRRLDEHFIAKRVDQIIDGKVRPVVNKSVLEQIKLVDVEAVRKVIKDRIQKHEDYTKEPECWDAYGYIKRYDTLKSLIDRSLSSYGGVIELVTDVHFEKTFTSLKEEANKANEARKGADDAANRIRDAADQISRMIDNRATAQAGEAAKLALDEKISDPEFLKALIGFINQFQVNGTGKI